MSARRESPPIIITPKPEEKPKVEPEQPIAPTPRKSSAGKIIAGIAILVLVIAAISFFSSGDKSLIDTAKEIYKGEPEIPVFADNFSDRTTAKDYTISIGSRGYISNGKYIAEGKDTTTILNRDFIDCDKITVKFSVKKIAGDGSSAFGCFIEDGYSECCYPTGYCDGVPQVLLQAIQERNPSFSLFKNGGIWTDKEYQVTLKRTVESDKVNLHFTVDSKSKSNEYPIPPRKPMQIGLRFISEDNAKFEIDNLEIYVYTT